MTSPFAPYANTQLTFQVATGALTTDPATGNVKPETTTPIVVTAILQQKNRSVKEREQLLGVDVTAIYLEGYAISPMLLPDSIPPYAKATAVWDGKAGSFTLDLTGRSPYGVAPLTGDKIRGYFQLGH